MAWWDGERETGPISMFSLPAIAMQFCYWETKAVFSYIQNLQKTTKG